MVKINFRCDKAMLLVNKISWEQIAGSKQIHLLNYLVSLTFLPYVFVLFFPCPDFRFAHYVYCAYLVKGFRIKKSYVCVNKSSIIPIFVSPSDGPKFYISSDYRYQLSKFTLKLK